MRVAGLLLVALAVGLGLWFGFGTPLGGVVFQLHPPLLNTVQAGIQRNLSPALWNDVIQPLLVLPNGVVPAVLGVLLLLPGLLRRRRHG
ncbi:hypothetical protein [Falsiroseomonas sp. CW058]|uniref:hypothetical protein n=1 Tax=Falsiroseomonas sp. CW058 TaxID=3388664 RepID=UPI003D31000F